MKRIILTVFLVLIVGVFGCTKNEEEIDEIGKEEEFIVEDEYEIEEGEEEEEEQETHIENPAELMEDLIF